MATEWIPAKTLQTLQVSTFTFPFPFFKMPHSDILDTSSDPTSDREVLQIKTEEDIRVVGGPVEPYCFVLREDFYRYKY